MLNTLRKELRKMANPEKAKIYAGFFKTGKGQYGEGDVFLGLTSQEIKNIAKKYEDLELNDLQNLLDSEVHEDRICALRILVKKYEKEIQNRKEIFDFYLGNSKKINNWDLVDTSAPYIVGHFLYHFGKEYPIYKILLRNLAKSSNLWERRIAIVATFQFIKNNEFDDTLKIAEILLNDKHDLIHKAVGWMLREVGKKNEKALEDFLGKNYSKMPRTMLRYAIERFDEDKRKNYLRGKFKYLTSSFL